MTTPNDVKPLINLETGRLKSGLYDQLNHNPLIDDHISDTLNNIGDTLNFLLDFVIAGGYDETKEIQPHEQAMAHMLVRSAYEALKFEEQRACIIMGGYQPRNDRPAS